MSETETRIIDLDLPAPMRDSEPATRLHRLAAVKIPGVAALVLMIVAGAVGAIGTSVWTGQYGHHPQRSTLSVLAFAETNADAADTGNGHIALDGQLTVVNAGLVPINVRSVRTSQVQVEFRDAAQRQSIEPGTASTIDVAMSLNCPSPSGPNHRLVISNGSSLIVEATNAPQSLSSSVSFDSGSWDQRLLQSCAMRSLSSVD